MSDSTFLPTKAMNKFSKFLLTSHFILWHGEKIMIFMEIEKVIFHVALIMFFKICGTEREKDLSKKIFPNYGFGRERERNPSVTSGFMDFLEPNSVSLKMMSSADKYIK